MTPDRDNRGLRREVLEFCAVLDTDVLLVEVDATVSKEGDNNAVVSVLEILPSLFSPRGKYERLNT